MRQYAMFRCDMPDCPIWCSARLRANAPLGRDARGCRGRDRPQRGDNSAGTGDYAGIAAVDESLRWLRRFIGRTPGAHRDLGVIENAAWRKLDTSAFDS